MSIKALIALEDGTILNGRSFTGHFEALGEMVFNTSMTGYQEILTDPSYCGQMVTMTYPLIGSYGVNNEDVESERIQVKAFIVREYQEMPSNWRSLVSLGDYLRRNNIPGIEGVDTRALTRHIRLQGAMKAAISTRDLDPDSLVNKAKGAPNMVGRDLVKEVTCKMPMLWQGGRAVKVEKGLDQFRWVEDTGVFHVVAIDYGIKYNILRSLEKRGCSTLLLPADADSDAVNRLEPHGLFLSNGPGDPAAVTYAVDTIKTQIGIRPVFGICLGHQLMGLALGGRTFKLKFGHRGGNQPVKDLSTGRVEITSQNHGFCVAMDSLSDPNIEPSHINLNDGTLEGLSHKKMPVFSVQYHPEASPGPHDSGYLFDRFIEAMKKYKN
jgi:carbamoyl-phosphate synthase small subunit